MVLFLLRLTRRLRRRRWLGMASVLVLVNLCVLSNATLYYLFEKDAKPDLTYGDAVWFSVVSITTIGYGDITAESTGARWSTFLFVVVAGLAVFSVFLGMLIDWVTEFSMRDQRGLTEVHASGHVLIVNFPCLQRVEPLIDEIQSDEEYTTQEIVLVNDTLEVLPITRPDVMFVRGSPLDADTFTRAKAADAQMAIVLATDYGDPASDALVSSAVAVLNSVAPALHVVAECVNVKHRLLFEALRCSAVVPSLHITNNVLVQEGQDPGASRLVEGITSNVSSTTLYSTPVKGPCGANYSELAKRLLDRDVNVLGVCRGRESHLSFRGLEPESGDRLLYIGPRRMSWDRLLEAAGLNPAGTQ